MANIVITKTATKIKIKYNDLSTECKWDVRFINRYCLSECSVQNDDSCVQIELRNGEIIMLDYSQVDSVDTVAPSDNVDLADKISDLML